MCAEAANRDVLVLDVVVLGQYDPASSKATLPPIKSAET
jgi:hypothetical protein